MVLRDAFGSKVWGILLEKEGGVRENTPPD